MPRKSASNIAALAARLHLSKGTVSRILNGDSAPFASETRVRVHSMAQEMGYVPNPIARALATGKTGVVSLWLPNLKTPYHALVAEAVENLIEDSGHRMSIRLFGRDEGSKEDYAQLVFDTVDGVITHFHPPDSWLKPFLTSGQSRPLIFTGEDEKESEAYSDRVYINLSKAAAEAVNYLISSGRKRVALFTPLPDKGGRTFAYLNVMKAAGREPEMIITIDNDQVSNRRIFTEYVREHGCPDGLFCHNDSGAIAVYQAATAAGIKIPEDMALIGCDGLLEGDYFPAPLSTIVYPVNDMAAYAWQFLKTRLDDPHTEHQMITLDAKLMLRQSSDA